MHNFLFLSWKGAVAIHHTLDEPAIGQSLQGKRKIKHTLK
jgi:hypothetical protein